MRKRNLFAFAFTVLITGTTVVAQTGHDTAPQPVTSYAWRATTSPAQKQVYPATPDSDQSIQPNQPHPLAAVPQNQSRRNKNLPVGYQQHQPEPSLTDAQPSVSDQSVAPREAPQAGSPTLRATPMLQPTPSPSPPPTASAAGQSFADPVPMAPATTVQPTFAVPALSVNDRGEAVAPDYCCRNCQKNRCNLGCERKLFPRNCNGLEIGGWTSLGYHNRNTILFNDRKSAANLHQQWLYFDKQAGVTSNWGYRADALYGIDAQNTQAFGNPPIGAPEGWDNSWDNGAYGFALPQAYLTYNNCLWDVKIGKFFAPFGYEVVAAPQNFFYSHSYTMNFTEPFTMSGIVGERRMSDRTSAILGATVGWDSAFERNTGGFNLITGTRFQPNDCVNLALTTSVGDTGYRDSGVFTSAVAQLKLTESVDYVLQGDVLNLQDNNEFGIVQYLFREVTPCLKLGARMEWWKSDRLFPDTKSTYEFTMGFNYRPHANLTLRPEVRFDWGAAAIDPGTPIAGVDAVITY